MFLSILGQKVLVNSIDAGYRFPSSLHTLPALDKDLMFRACTAVTEYLADVPSSFWICTSMKFHMSL